MLQLAPKVPRVNRLLHVALGTHMIYPSIKVGIVLTLYICLWRKNLRRAVKVKKYIYGSNLAPAKLVVPMRNTRFVIRALLTIHSLEVLVSIIQLFSVAALNSL